MRYGGGGRYGGDMRYSGGSKYEGGGRAYLAFFLNHKHPFLF